MKIRDMTRCALFAALLAVCSWLSVPVGDLAVSMQTFAVFLILDRLGGRKGLIAIGVYVVLGAVGVPVFTGMRAGLGVLAGPTGGYIWGFLAAAGTYWALEGRVPKAVALALGMLVCYACGTVWYELVYGPLGWWPVIAKCVLPYLIPDGAKLALAMLVARRLRKV